MTPSVLYLLLDRPWRWRTILRAWRVHRAREAMREHDDVQFYANLRAGWEAR